MSMIGEYAGLTPAELDRALREPEWAYEFVDWLMEAEPREPGAAQPRCLDIDKSWDFLGLLLRRIDFPVDIVRGEEEIPQAGNWGYGPPRYLTPDRVRAAAEALSATPGHALVRNVSAPDLVRDDLYPRIAADDLGPWLTYIVHPYDALVPFFAAAARDGDAVMVWLD
jgi:hypothetical protein